MRVVYKNWDGLDMAFHGRFPNHICLQLDAAKAAAAAARTPVAFDLGGVPVQVAETGRRGGFQWVLDTGEDGESWAIAAPRITDTGRTDSRGHWAVTVSVKSAAFVQHGGLEAIRDRIAARLTAWEFVATRCAESGLFDSVSRFDFATDILVDDDFALDPQHIVSKGSKTGYLDGATAHWAGRRVTGCTVGKMPNRQVCIYDKVKDAVAKGKLYWFEAWGLDRDEKPQVWRVETRAGKNFLRKTWGVRCFDDLMVAAADIVADTLCKVRLAEMTDSNITRCPDAPLWRKVKEAVETGLADLFSGLCPGVIKEIVRERFNVTMEGLFRGVALTWAAVEEGKEAGINDLKNRFQQAAEAVIRHMENEPEEVLEKAAKARNRYKLIEAEKWEQRNRHPMPAWLA